MDCSMMGRWNGVFVTITCADGERFEEHSVPQFSNARNHRQNLVEPMYIINDSRPTLAEAARPPAHGG